ncbi:hypothetical protein RRG08_052911 [Elysia crispata]|uniref:Uncharacterized protein n=1 Tax=Elysia crispata TaxID=231223 RepID=A0AAE0ZE52_9GAST|nr:hypothetical protein RRG08_052911 [Elysia crispata]
MADSWPSAEDTSAYVNILEGLWAARPPSARQGIIIKATRLWFNLIPPRAKSLRDMASRLEIWPQTAEGTWPSAVSLVSSY